MKIARKIAEIATSRMSKEERTVFARGLLPEEFDPLAFKRSAMELGAWNLDQHNHFKDCEKSVMRFEDWEGLCKHVDRVTAAADLFLTEDEVEGFAF